MKKALFMLLLLILLFTGISALCEEGQIDINNASLEELDELVGIGPVKAQAIIDARPFSSVDNLIDVFGIGDITLEKIKTQDLACVEEEEEDEEIIEDEESKEEIKEEVLTMIEEIEIIENSTENIQKITGNEVKTIALNPKDIKSETDKEQLNKNKLATYGLMGFCILLVSLFVLKKKENKNEFR